MSFALPTHTTPIASPRGGLDKELRAQVPQLQISPSAGDSSNNPQMSPPVGPASPATASPPPSPRATHRRFVLTDYVAFRYLEEDPSVTVLARRQKLEGYEVYLVEQWACSRAHSTFIITTFSGDPKDIAWGSILSVPADESTWSPQLRIYLKSLDQYHARRTETTYGTLMVTNLSAFPSSLTVIPVPDGDARKNKEMFYVNVDLKRLGCSGRLGITLAHPNGATQAKFHQLYRISDKNKLNSAVIELVKLCQIALVIFAKLELAYADGLLCDMTEKAIGDWWVEFGAEYYTVEPNDGILGPTTVAALLGMLMGARNRLSAQNEPIGKDVFDIESTKRAITHFQKSQHIPKTGLLNRQTLDRLRRATAKAASKEGWNMPRALKSTVAELGGKGGEMVMGMVGAGDKAGIADIETVDIDRFVELVRGETAKWLWLGKPRKSTVAMFSRLPGEEGSSPDEPQSATSKLSKKETTPDDHRDNRDLKLTKRDTNPDEGKKHHELSGIAEGVDKDKDPYSKRAAIKRATEKIESGSGFHRIKGVVGRRNHQHKSSKEESTNGPVSLQQIQSEVGRSLTEITSGAPARRTVTDIAPLFTKTVTETPRDSASTLDNAVDDASQPHRDEPNGSAPAHKLVENGNSGHSKQPTENFIADSIYQGIDKLEKLPYEPVDTAPLPLRRTQSTDNLTFYHVNQRNTNWWPRHLSFSIAEESVLTWSPLTSTSRSGSDSESSFEAMSENGDASSRSLPSLQFRLASLTHLSTQIQNLHAQLTSIALTDKQWTTSTIQDITDLDNQAEADIAELEQMYYSRLEEYQSLRDDAHEIVARDRIQLQDAMRDLETLGAKLDYEIGTLKGKVDDIESGVTELERQVNFVEERVHELERVVQRGEGWVHWWLRILFGIGKHPV